VPIGKPVPSSAPADTHADGKPSRLAGKVGRNSSMVAAVELDKAAAPLFVAVDFTRSKSVVALARLRSQSKTSMTARLNPTKRV
jgi:hypothetical protein